MSLLIEKLTIWAYRKKILNHLLTYYKEEVYDYMHHYIDLFGEQEDTVEVYKNNVYVYISRYSIFDHSRYYAGKRLGFKVYTVSYTIVEFINELRHWGLFNQVVKDFIHGKE